MRDAADGAADALGLRRYMIGIFAFTFARSLWVACPILVLTGMCLSYHQSLNATLLQLVPPAEMRGRLTGLHTMAHSVSPFSALGMGFMVDRWGAPHVIAGAVLAAMAIMLPVALCSRSVRRM